MLIAVSEVDCPRKSTQIELLSDHFRRRGCAVETLWYRPGSPALDAAHVALKRLRSAALPAVLVAGRFLDSLEWGQP